MTRTGGRTKTVSTENSTSTSLDTQSLSSAEHLEQIYTTDDIEALAGEITRTTSNPYAEDTTSGDTEFSGEEPIDFILTLSTEKRAIWVVKRLAAFQEAMYNYANYCKAAKEADPKRSITEIEWDAVAATGAITRVVPHEGPVYKWILGKKEEIDGS